MNRRERKKEETRLKLISVAMDLFKKKGFQNTTMEEIAEIGDVSKGTLYNYYQDKETILCAYFQRIFKDKRLEIVEALNKHKTIEGKLSSLLDMSKEVMGEDLGLSTIYFKHRLQTFFDNNSVYNLQRSSREELLLELITEAQEKKEIRNDIPASVIARTFQFLSLNYFITSTYDKASGNKKNFKEHLMEMFLNGVKL